jgi:hypothetical protein
MQGLVRLMQCSLSINVESSPFVRNGVLVILNAVKDLLLAMQKQILHCVQTDCTGGNLGDRGHLPTGSGKIPPLIITA